MGKEKILIIGASGQLGTELVEALRNIYGASSVIASDIRKSDNPVFETKEKTVRSYESNKDNTIRREIPVFTGMMLWVNDGIYIFIIKNNGNKNQTTTAAKTGESKNCNSYS